jgi:hypothetical protein
MDKSFPLLKLSPCKLRLNYTLTSKSTKSTKSKQHPSHSIEPSSEVNSRRLSLSPKKANIQSVSSELIKLEEELDSDEISLKLYEIRENSNEQKLTAETEVYDNYISGIIQYISRKNMRLANCLLRGWKGYKKTVATKENYLYSLIPKIELKEFNDFSSGVTEEMISPPVEVNVDDYILSLHSVLKGMSHMNINRIMSKLGELTVSLKPMDVPSPSSSPDIEELDFTETIKAIHSKLKASIAPKIKDKSKQVIKTYKEGATQTAVKIEDFKLFENLKTNVMEKDRIIAEISNKLRSKEEIEELYSLKLKECEELKGKILEIKTTLCPQCSQKKKKLEEHQEEIKSLQLTVYKSITIEKELEQAKTKLKETLSVVSVKNNKIIELSDSLVIVQKKVENILAEQEDLRKKLEVEEKEKQLMEMQLQKEINSNLQLKKLIKMKGTAANNLEFDLEEEEIEAIPKISPGKKSRELGKTVEFSPEKKKPLTPSNNKLQFEKFTSNTPSDTFHEIPLTQSPSRKKSRIRVEITHREAKSHNEIDQDNKKAASKVLSALNMTKEEYLSLPAKIRLELYECLYEHKEKCGADCEHLKRAMMIRYKNRGVLYPTKKFNIS